MVGSVAPPYTAFTIEKDTVAGDRCNFTRGHGRVTELQRWRSHNRSSMPKVEMSEGEMPLSVRTDAAAAFQEAILQHRMGQLQHANRLCEEVLHADPCHAAAWHMRGLIALNGPHPERGVEWIEHSLELDANQPSAHVNLGNYLLAQNLPESALGRFERALQLRPDYALALYNHGNALSAMGRFAEGLLSYDRALQLQGHWTIQNNRGLALRKLKRLAEAAAAFEAAVQLDAQAVDAWSNLGATYLELQRPRDALECLQGACRRAENSPDCWCGLGNVWLALKQPVAAFDAYSKALRLRPDHADALCGRCAAALTLQRPAAALADAEAALGLGQPSATLLNNLGNVLAQLDRGSEALLRYEEVLRLDPASTDALYNQAALLRRLARPADAAQICAQLLRIAPQHRYALGLHFQLCMDLCEWRDYEAMVTRLMDPAGEHRDIVNPMTLLLLDSPQLQLRGVELFAAEQCLAIGARSLPAFADPSGLTAPRESERGKIRIAYLSADFREHPVAQLLVGVLEQHDRSRFEVLGVAFTPAERSSFGRRIRSAFDVVLDVQDRSDDAVAALLRERKVDIAVDLMGFTQDQRIGIFTHRPAPIQVAFLGFAGTTGLPCLDYLIADRVSLPDSLQDFFSEQIARLPQCLLPHDDRRAIGPAPPRSILGLPESGMVFCAFTNSCKINPPIFNVWMRVLRECPGSVLWLREASAQTMANLAREAQRRGVSPARLIFAARMHAMSDHLARLSCADMFLDTSPYNAHSTACDALWAGVPVITCKGRTLASRIAASALNEVGLAELAAETPGQYQEIILRLARQPETLREIRARLNRARLDAPLFQTAAYTRHLERAFETMQQRAQRGAAAAGFCIDS
jgi:protein O-GlcNAc transferase